MKKPDKTVFHYLSVIILIMLSTSLASCKISASEGSETTQPAADAIFTAAAQTAEARRIERITQTAAKAPVETSTQPPSETTVEIPTQASPETSGEPPGSSTTPALTMPPEQPITTITLPSTDVAVVPGEDKAVFIDDVTVPDGTKYPPGKHFQKTWRIENTGKTTWDGTYALVFIDGNLMGGSSVVALPQKVTPWDKVNVTVDMVAPAEPGKYTGYWKLRNASGKIFGFGETGDEAIWVQIVVEAALASDLESTAEETSSPITQTQTVGAVSLSVDEPVINGCPHTFRLTALINLKEAATVTYSLEGGDNAGGQLRFPLPATRNLDAGAHPVIYELTFSKSVTGWARLRITQPDPVVSDQVNFSLNCG